MTTAYESELERLDRICSGMLREMMTVVSLAESRTSAVGESSVDAARLSASTDSMKKSAAELSDLIRELQLSEIINSLR